MRTTTISRQRYRTDCGPTALAFIAGRTWEETTEAMQEQGKGPGCYGLTYTDMGKLSRRLGVKLSRWSGTPVASGKGESGVILAHVDCGWSDDKLHWLAFTRESDGRVTVHNPADGTSWPLQNMHLEGYRMRMWAYVKEG